MNCEDRATDADAVRRRISLYAWSLGLSEAEGRELAVGIVSGLPPSSTMADAMRAAEDASACRVPSPLPAGACVAPPIRRRSMTAAPLEYFPCAVRLLRRMCRFLGAGHA